MQEQLSRRSFVKVAGLAGATAAGLAVGLIEVPAAKGALVPTSVTIDFTNTTLDKVTFRGQLDGISVTTDPAELQVTVSVKNLATLEEQVWSGHPDTVK